MFRHDKREVPLLNTTATADISFMLLILFLVTTSMDIDKGLSRQLPPPEPKEEQQQMDVKEGMVLKLEIAADNTLSCDGKAMPVAKLKAAVANFVSQKGAQHVIQLQADRQSAYNTYFQVQNEIVAAYHALRDRHARKLYGKPYDECVGEQQEKVCKLVPQRISEVYQTEEGGDR